MLMLIGHAARTPGSDPPGSQKMDAMDGVNCMDSARTFHRPEGNWLKSLQSISSISSNPRRRSEDTGQEEQ